ncbi:MAG TPA: hypothetical protein VHD56_19035 [Tepidisphaeraceae bacterium]|nr:hypothetical protein [Tepidisphaeraceae bacterium]
MRNRLKGLSAAIPVVIFASTTGATPVFNETFDGYTNGNLVGQSGWTESNSGTQAVTVAGSTDKFVSLTSSGQDAYKAFTSNVNHTDGNAIYTGADITVTAAQSGGDYFLNLGETLGGSFDERLFAKSTTGGFFFGLQDTSGAVTYGTTVLSLNTKYHIALTWNFVAGATNDTMVLYVNPTNITEGSNTAYLNYTWTAAEPTILKTANLRQGSASAAPTATIDNFVVGTAFTDVVPEPAGLAIALVGVLPLMSRRRRSK